MARKSRNLRLTQTKDMIQQYESAGLSNDKVCHFMRDMEYRLERNKALSAKRRSWLDKIIDEGVPAPKNEHRVNEILEAANLEGMQEKKSILEDFAGKIRRGWSLSEKQEAWLDKLLVSAKDIRENGIWEPSDDLKADLEICLKLAKRQGGYYWQHRPGAAKAYTKVEAYVDGDNKYIDEWACTKFTNNFKKQLSEVKNPKHMIGDMRYIGHSGEIVMITDNPFVDDSGRVKYPVLASGSVRNESSGNIFKRKRK